MKLFSAFFLLWSCCTFAQHDSLFQQCSGRNLILFPEHLNEFFQRITKEKNAFEESVNITQIGDSHVQMGWFPKALNAGLDTLFGGSEDKSFWFPYSFVGGYTPNGYKVIVSAKSEGKRMVNSTAEDKFAITGHSLDVQSTEDEYVDMTVVFNGKRFDQLEILLENTEQWSLWGSDSLKVFKGRPYEDLVVYSVRTNSPVDSMTIALSGAQGAEPLRILGFRCFTNLNSSAVIGFQFYGSSGAKYSDYIVNDDYFRQSLDFIRTDLLIISLGTNDSYLKQGKKFRRDVTKFIKGLKKEFPKLSILLTLPPDKFYANQRPRSGAFVNRTLIGIAKKYKCAVWDFGNVMGGDQSILSWCSDGLTHEDLLHLNQAGYDLQGLLLSEAIFKAYSDWKVK